MKDKFKKIFRVLRIVLSILVVIGLVFSVIVNVEMHKILEVEEVDNSEFFQLKVAIAQCYLAGKEGLIGSNEGLYKDYLYSKNCESSLNTAKWLASKIDLRGQVEKYGAEMNLPFKKKLFIRVDDLTLQQIVDNQESRSRELVMYNQQIDVIMHYDNVEKEFIVKFDYE